MTDDKKKGERADERGPGLTGAQKGFVGLLTLVFLGSVAGRVAGAGESEPQPAGEAAGGELVTGLTSPNGTTPVATAVEEPSALEEFLPYLTEGSFFGLMGFAVGYATRKIVKMLLLVIAVGFLGMQLLSSGGLVDVDWGGIIGWLNELVFNLKENQTFTEVLTDRVPSSGAFLLGVVLGFKRG